MSHYINSLPENVQPFITYTSLKWEQTRKKLREKFILFNTDPLLTFCKLLFENFCLKLKRTLLQIILNCDEFNKTNVYFFEIFAIS